MRRSKRYSTVAFNGFGDHFAPRAFDDQGMKLLVHVPVPGFVGLDQMSLCKNLITFPETLMERMDQPTRWSLFGEQASGQAFQHTAHVDRIHELLRRERTHNESTRVQLGQQALLRQDGEGITERG